jgi:two-component system chemotaxis response regulator CheB
MPPSFIESLAQHLDNKSQLKVKVAEDHESVRAGTAYIAPGGVHTKLGSNYKIRLDDSPPLNGIRPAADVLFGSIAESFAELGVLVVILTGMGNDGEAGLTRLKEKLSCYCLAQSEKTCVVYGMPRAVAEAGLADAIVDLDKIPAEIESLDYANMPDAREKS